MDLEHFWSAFYSFPSPLLRGALNEHFSCALKDCNCSCRSHRICHNFAGQIRGHFYGGLSANFPWQTVFHTPDMLHSPQVWAHCNAVFEDVASKSGDFLAAWNICDKQRLCPRCYDWRERDLASASRNNIFLRRQDKRTPPSPRGLLLCALRDI